MSDHHRNWFLLALLGGGLSAGGLAGAEEEPPAADGGGAAVAEEEEDVWPTGPWDITGEAGAFLNATATGNADDSRDPTIAGTEESIAYLVSLDGTAEWHRGPHALEQLLQLRFGKIKQEDDAWEENNDLIDYDAIYKYAWRQPHYAYGAMGIDSVFTGAEPDEEPFDPITYKLSAGYGQKRFINREPKRLLEFRVGVRAQRTWGDDLTEQEREWEIGPELWARYEAKPFDKMKYWIEYEAFGEFEDLGHWTNLLTASMTYQFNSVLSLKLDLRAYLETEPEDAQSEVGYDEVSFKQDTLLGLVYSF